MKKQRKSKVARVELRAGGRLHGSEKPWWSAGGMVKEPGNEQQQMRNNTPKEGIEQHKK